MSALIAAAIAFLAFYALWVFYLAVMNLKRVHDATGLPPVAKWLGMPLIVIGIGWDRICNCTVFSLLFLEWPATRGELVTGRLKRYAAPGYPEGRRKRMTHWFAFQLLDPFDPSGRHV